MTAHEAGVLDTSIIAALALYDSAQLPETFFITAITLGELSYGPHATDDPLKRAARVAVLPDAANPRIDGDANIHRPRTPLTMSCHRFGAITPPRPDGPA